MQKYTFATNRKSDREVTFAARPGIEPRLPLSESGVLPLDDLAICLQICKTTYMRIPQKWLFYKKKTNLKLSDLRQSRI